MNPIKLSIAAAIGSLLWCGCSTRVIRYGDARYYSTRIFQKEDFTRLEVVATNGTKVFVENYRMSGDTNAIKASGALIGEAANAAGYGKPKYTMPLIDAESEFKPSFIKE